MALQPHDIASFEREVDENYRRDRAADFAKANAKWIVIGLLAILAIVAGVLYWQHSQKEKAGEQAEELAKVMTDFVEGEREGLDTRLQAISNNSDGATKATAMMTEAALALDAGNRTRASELFAAIAADGDMPGPYRDVAAIRDVQLNFDTIEPADVVARLQSIAQPGNPFFGSAGELTAAALLKMGREEEAGQLYAQMGEDQTVPETIRSRAVQMASSLGVSSDAAPGAETTEEQE